MLAAIVLASAITGLPLSVHGDFDHDGKADVAQVVSAHGKYQLVIRRGARPRSVMVLATFDEGSVRRLYVAKAKPGKWETWCGKGGGSDDDDPCPRKYVNLHGDTLSFGMEEASMSVAIWTGHRFDVVLLSD